MTSSTTIRLGTRGSKLAMWQSTWVKQALEGLGCSVELVQIKTEGDVATGSLSQIGGQGKIADIRGNVDTRLRKLDDGDYDAIVLAAAGLTRLGWQDRITSRFSPEELLPAVGQGALGLETRTDDGQTNAIVSQLNHAESFAAAMAERHMLRALFAGCLAPVGAVTRMDKGNLELTGVVLATDGQTRIEVSASSVVDQYAQLGQSVAKQLVEKGADVLLKSAQA